MGWDGMSCHVMSCHVMSRFFRVFTCLSGVFYKYFAVSNFSNLYELDSLRAMICVCLSGFFCVCVRLMS
jgi:hypothetical protein